MRHFIRDGESQSTQHCYKKGDAINLHVACKTYGYAWHIKILCFQSVIFKVQNKICYQEEINGKVSLKNNFEKSKGHRLQRIASWQICGGSWTVFVLFIAFYASLNCNLWSGKEYLQGLYFSS